VADVVAAARHLAGSHPVAAAPFARLAGDRATTNRAAARQLAGGLAATGAPALATLAAGLAGRLDADHVFIGVRDVSAVSVEGWVYRFEVAGAIGLVVNHLLVGA